MLTASGLLKSRLPKFTQIPKFLMILIVLGILLRFYNLGHKVYWSDETMTSLRMSGRTQTELVNQVFNGQPVTAGDLLAQYQSVQNGRTLQDTMNALKGNPEHSPLYYLMARFWGQTVGDSVASIRLLSALLSLLTFPCIYWLCLELFGSPLVGWSAMALIAISPFHVLYAQEAREYSLWMVTILLSSATLLWAMRDRTGKRWSVYGATLALGFYTHPFSAFVAVSHGIYVFVTERFRPTWRLLGYLLAVALGVLLFLPWLLVVIENFAQLHENTGFLGRERGGFLPLYWGLNLSRIFFDVNQGTSPLNPLLYLIVALTLYALYFLYRQGPLQAWVFVMALIGVTGTALIGADLILGGHRSSIPRYAVPCYLGIEIAVAYLLTTQLTRLKQGSPGWKRWKWTAIALVFVGLVSCIVSAQFPVWWNKSHAKSFHNPAVAQLINQADRPLVVSDSPNHHILPLLHLLRPDVQMQLVVGPNVPQILPESSEVFLYRPSDPLRQSLEQQGRPFEDIHESWLWRQVR